MQKMFYPLVFACLIVTGCVSNQQDPMADPQATGMTAPSTPGINARHGESGLDLLCAAGRQVHPRAVGERPARRLPAAGRPARGRMEALSQRQPAVAGDAASVGAVFPDFSKKEAGLIRAGFLFEANELPISA